MNTALFILLICLVVYSLNRAANELHKKKELEMKQVARDLQIAIIRFSKRRGGL